MNLFRPAIFAMCAVLIFSIGPSSSATTNYSHPAFSVADDRVLNLREAGSKIVVETIEDALRAGGIALFDERFQIDSSLDWVLGEAVGGELEAVVPLWSKDGHVVFAQPGFVLWNGLADDDRLDGNLGVVYRTNLLNTPVGFDAIGGISLFYDHDFQIGHSRLGIGVDVQRDGLHGAFNYYHPLSDTQDGREGYVEDALQGMDASLAVESDVTRVGGNVGYWLFQRDEEVKDEWEFSYGLDAGLRLMPGVFLEGRLERHDKKASFGRRASVGLAFRFTLPNLDGKSYGDGGTVLNLYRPVDRESRILYEEREAVPKANLVVSGTGNTRNITVQLEETFAEEVVLNLIGAGSATYNDDWTISVGGDDCPVVDGTDCSVTVMAGETGPSDEVVITFQDPARGEPAEDIILSVEIASTGVELAPGNPVVVQIPEGEPLPTVSLSADKTSIAEGDTATITLTLSERLGGDATFTLTGSNDDAEYSSFADYHFTINQGATVCSTQCPIRILAGEASFEVTVNVNADSVHETTAETFTASLTIDQPSTDIVQVGSTSVLNFSIPADPPLPTVTISTSDTTIMEGLQRSITLTLSEAVDEEVTLNLIADTSGTADYGSSNDWVLNDGSGACTSATGMSCQITIPANSTTAMTRILVIENMSGEGDETAIVRVMVDSGSAHLVQEGSQSRLTFTIPADPPLPTVSWSAARTNITEGLQITLTLTLSGALGSPATFNLVNDSGDSATYGFQDDWYLTVDSTVCNSASGTGCQVTIDAGETSAEVNLEARLDSVHETTSENFTVSVVVDPGSRHLVQEGNPSSLPFTIPADPPLPTVSLGASSTDVKEGDTRTITLTLSGALRSNAMFHLVTSGDAGYGLTNGDWVFTDISCVSDSSGRNACPVTISQGATSATANIMILTDTATERMETATVTVEVDSGSTHLVEVGSPSALSFAIEATQHTVSFENATGTAEEGGDVAAVNLVISPYPVAEEVEIPITIMGNSATNVVSFISVQENATFQNGVLTVPILESGNIGFSVKAGQDANNDSETITVSLGTPLPPNFTVGTNSTWTVTTNDDEPSGSISFTTVATAVTEDGNTLPSVGVLVAISPQLSSPSSVGVKFSGTADSSDYTISGGNYQAVTGETGIDGIMTLPANSSREALATIRATDDSTTEGPETIIITLSNRSGANALPSSHGIVQGTITITITDDD